MKPVTVILPGPLRRVAGGAEVRVEAATVAEALAAAVAARPGLAGRITDPAGRLRPFVKVFVSGAEAALEAPLAAGAEVVVAPALSGG